VLKPHVVALKVINFLPDLLKRILRKFDDGASEKHPPLEGYFVGMALEPLGGFP